MQQPAEGAYHIVQAVIDVHVVYLGAQHWVLAKHAHWDAQLDVANLHSGVALNGDRRRIQDLRNIAFNGDRKGIHDRRSMAFNGDHRRIQDLRNLAFWALKQ